MLKTAKKLSQGQQKNNRLLKTTTVSQETARRSITTHHVYEGLTLKGQSRKDILDTHASIRHHIGYLRLNREHRYNLFTPNYMKNIRRSLETLNLDEVVKVIYMTGGRGEHFSNGTDFRTLLHYKSEGAADKIANYLEELYGLHVQASKLNKPLISVAPGHAFNSGATFLQASGLPTVTLDTKLCFNEVSFGFVPHGGSSYYLSRLPGEIGTFLALTGLPITGIDAKEFGLVDELVHYSKAYEEEVSDVMFAMELPIPNQQLLSNYGRFNPWRQQLEERQASDEQQALAEEYERSRKKHDNIIHEEFMEPKDKKPSVNAETDHKYKQLLKQYNKRFEESNQEGYLGEHDQGVYQNYYAYILKYIKSQSGSHEYPKDPRSSILIKNAKTISRCFYPSSLEEIQENLRREAAEGSSFAKMCLQKMDANSTLSMKIALKLLRDARSLDFKGALQNEINVALNKIGDKEFDLGISEVLLKPHRTTDSQGVPVNPGFIGKPSQDQVQSYFAPNKWAEEVKLDLVEKALLPTRFYYEKFSDQVRLWINEESTPQPEVRETFEAELKEALREQGIDIRDRALTIEAARSQIFNQEQVQRRQKAWEERLEQFMNDDKLREGYFSQTREYLERLDKGPSQEFYALVNKNIQEIFENAYLEKLQTIFNRSAEAHSLEKRRMFIRFKKFLFQSRILTYAHEEFDRLYAILKNLPHKEVHITEQWNGDKSFRELEHPDLKQSFLYYLSKSIGKASLAPPELAKAFLTDGSGTVQKAMTTYTFDKAELERLRADILAHPEKYEKALRERKERVSNFISPGDKKLMQKAKKREEHDYWFRVLNEGILPSDTLPYYKQLSAYRDFVDQVETRAFDTLRMTVQRLLLDFEEKNGKNVVSQFEQKQSESKHQALRRLMAVINESSEDEAVKELPSTSAVVSGKQQNPLAQTTRSTKDIKRQLNQLLEKDIEMAQIIPKAETFSTSNSLINRFREEVISDLYQLIEFALINSPSPNNRAGSALPPKHLLQERLASLTNPQNAQQKNVTNLRILDAYLNEQNSEHLIKDAIRLVKPYFFANVLAPRLQQEARKVFDAFKAEATSNEVLFYYMFNQEYPDARFAHITKRMLSYNEARDRDMYIEALFPDQSRSFYIKRYISMMGQSGAPIKTAQDLEAATRQEYEGLENLQKQNQDIEEQFQAQTNKAREAALRKPFNYENVDSEIDNHASMKSIYQYDLAELEELAKFSERAEELRNYLELNQQEIRNSIGLGDWLHVFGSALTHYDLDLSNVFRTCTAPKQGESSHGLSNAEKYLEDMQNAFGGDRTLTWEAMGEFSNFLSSLYEAGQKATVDGGKQVLDSYSTMSDFIVKQLDIVNGEELLKSQSLFEMMKSNELSLKKIGSRSESMREELKDLANLKRRLARDRVLRDSIESLSAQAPKDVKDLVSSIVANHGNSDYLNMNELERILRAKEYEKLRSHGLSQTLIDKESLFSDLRKKSGSKHLEKFLAQYLDTRLDVVSLAQARETVAHAQTSTTFDEKLQSQIKLVLDFAEDSLRYIPHSRREAMTLGDFIQRHGYLSSHTTPEKYMPDILKRKIQEVIGNYPDINGADLIDWEFGSVRTNPMIHAQEDTRVKTALAEGRGYNAEATTDATIESQLNGKGAQELGEAALIGYINPTTGIVEVDERPNYEYEQVLRDAKSLTKLTPGGTYMKNYFENELLGLYSSPEFDAKAVEDLVQRYTELRLKDCMLNPQFAEKAKQGNNGHIYLKMLKEQITEELQINQPAKASDFTFDKMFEDYIFKTDVEGRYSANDVSNLQSVGLEKLTKEGVESNADSTLDKLLGDYFLQKRGQYVAHNELLQQLNQQFGPKAAQFEDGHMLKTNNKHQQDPNAYPFPGQPNLAYAYLKQNFYKEENPKIVSQDFTAMMELDIATAQAIHNNKNGLGEGLRQEIPEEALTIPEYFTMFDCRKPVHQYVEGKLRELLDQIFTVRRSVEKTLSRNELLAYDRALARHLTKEILLPRLKASCEGDRNQLLQLKQAAQLKTEGKENEQTQFLKTHNEQGEFNKNLKNEDALYKFLAYSGMLEQKRREDINKTRKNNEMIFGVENFEEFYKRELQRDAQRDPRPVNPEDYLPKRGAVTDLSKAGEGFKPKKEQEADYFREFELFKENKKEQLERNQLFYVLEQFFSHAKHNPDPMNKAQQAIVDYFKDTENTFFFDKNKIQ